MTSRTEPYAVLIRKAADDFHVLERLISDEQAADWILGFHAQQSVEKALKAVLAHAGVVFPRTHNLSMLLELLAQAHLPLPPDSQEFARLTPLGVVGRYEVGQGEELAVDRSSALRSAANALEWAKAVVGHED